LDPKLAGELPDVQPGFGTTIDLDATATNALDDNSTASVTASNSASTDLDPGICAYYNYSS